MTSPRLALIGLVLIALAVLAYFLTSHQAVNDSGNGAGSGQGPMVVAPAIAPPATPAATPMVKTTGNYAGDWQSKCGPLTDPKAQAQCTASLDAAYGREAGVAIPVPPSGK